MPKISKEEAADILKSSARTVERLAGSGRLSVTYEQGKTRKVPRFEEAEVRQLKAELDGQTSPARAAVVGSEGIATRGDNGDKVGALLSLLGSQDFWAGVVNMHAPPALPPAPGADGHAEPSVPLADKLTLNLAEAAQLSGLSRNRLREAITEKKLKGRIIGRGWKIKRDDLDLYVKKL
jgi:excisionase family DNA binding protein